MGENKNTTSNPMSLSKERKLARKKEIAQMKRNKIISRIVSICVVVVLVAGIGSLVGYKIYRNSVKVTASQDFSLGLKDDGFIDGVTAKDYVDLCDYNNITVTSEDVSYTEEELAKDIQDIVAKEASLSTTTTAAIADKDEVNIDYVGTVDGQEFEGGNSNKEGYDLTIGSGEFIDDFEQQLIGHKIGDSFDVNVTFPEDYSNDPSLAGKEATFAVTINGIYVAPEFNDAFVKENLYDTAKTAEEYKTYLRETNYNTKLETFINDYLNKNCEVKEYPSSYMSDLKAVTKLQEYYMFQSFNNFYQQLGSEGYSTFDEFLNAQYDKSEFEYDKGLAEEIKPTAKENLIYQAICENEGITVTEDDFNAYNEAQGTTEEQMENQLAQCGKGYLMQEVMKDKVIDTIKATIKK